MLFESSLLGRIQFFIVITIFVIGIIIATCFCSFFYIGICICSIVSDLISRFKTKSF